MQPQSHAFKENARAALADDRLRAALGNMKAGFQNKRAAAIDALVATVEEICAVLQPA